MSQSKMLATRRRKQSAKKRMDRVTKQAKKLKRQEGKTARAGGAQEGHT